MSRWFRFYSAAMRHPKVARLSDRDFRLWTQLLAIAAEHDGKIPCLDDLKHLLNARLDHLSSALDRLVNGGLIDVLGDAYTPHNWNEKQYKSDTSTVRVQKYRSKGNVSETLAETPPETDTETDKKILADLPGPKPGKPVRTRNVYPADFETFWSGYPTDSNMSKAETGKVWAKLSSEDRLAAIASLPEFKAYCRRSPDYRPVHAERYLKWRRFDGFRPASAGDGNAADPRIDFGGGISAPLSTVRQRFEQGRWRPEWRGRPDEPGCVIPREFWSQILPKKAQAEQPPQGGLFH